MQATLIDHMGTDLTVCNSARVSFNKESDWVYLPGCEEANTDDEWVLSNQDTKLINYLAKHNHWTPFSHPMITMRETVPIFVARERFRHTVGFTYNEVSRRYVDDAPEFYVPGVWRSRPEGSVKQGSGSERVLEIAFDDGISQSIKDAYEDLITFCKQTYNAMIANGVAPEQARMLLPQSAYTSYYVTGSLAAWARAYKLRSDHHAQMEIQELAKQWEAIIRPLFPVSWGALTRVDN